MNRLLFILPVGGGSGGAHSVMQEADAMWSFGIQTYIASNTANAAKLRHAYREFPRLVQNIYPYSNVDELARLIDTLMADVAIATTNQSVHVLSEALAARTSTREVRTAYYIQDYEPLFYEYRSDDWHKAFSSFNRIQDMVCFAKTRWLQEVVQNNHGIVVHKVEPSVDHLVYYPDLSRRIGDGDTMTVVAMIRPSTPRRAPRRTCRILNTLKALYGDRIVCAAFGAMNEELSQEGLRLKGVENHGLLGRGDVGHVFRGTDLFLDLSDYQAFGRTAIEAMSCGALSVVPAHGGAHEFARDGVNGFVVDTRCDEQVLEAVDSFFSMSQLERASASMAAVSAGYRFTPEVAALSELKLLLA